MGETLISWIGLFLPEVAASLRGSEGVVAVAGSVVAAVPALAVRSYLAFAIAQKLPDLAMKLPSSLGKPALYLIDRGQNSAVAIDMLGCSLFFLPWALPRETVSGLFGRWMIEGNAVQAGIAHVGCLALHVFDRGHCARAYLTEKRMREVTRKGR